MNDSSNSSSPPPVVTQTSGGARSEKPGKNKGCLIGVAVAGVVALLILVGFIVLIVKVVPDGGTRSFPEELVEGSILADGKVAVIRVNGVIESDGPRSMGEAVVRMLRQARDDKDVKAVLLRVNTPGGGVTASDEIYHAIKQVRAKGKPVVVYMETMATSGGFYIACAADKVFANETTLTGSIGVIIGSYNLTGLMDKVGVKPMVFRSGEFKDTLSPTREMRDDEIEYIQSLVDESYTKFLGLVAEARGLDPEVLRNGLADGRIMSGATAKEVGLIDECGYLDDALAAVKKLAGDSDLAVVEYRSVPKLSDILALGAKSDSKIEVNLGSEFKPDLKPGVPYLLPAELIRGF